MLQHMLIQLFNPLLFDHQLEHVSILPILTLNACAEYLSKP